MFIPGPQHMLVSELETEIYPFFDFDATSAYPVADRADQELDHCIDSIRQNLICHADLAVMTFHWVGDSEDPKPNFKYEHECVDWKALESWAMERAFDVDNPKMLARPESV
jgi:hypothetical protein